MTWIYLPLVPQTGHIPVPSPHRTMQIITSVIYNYPSIVPFQICLWNERKRCLHPISITRVSITRILFRMHLPLFSSWKLYAAPPGDYAVYALLSVLVPTWLSCRVHFPRWWNACMHTCMLVFRGWSSRGRTDTRQPRDPLTTPTPSCARLQSLSMEKNFLQVMRGDTARYPSERNHGETRGSIYIITTFEQVAICS